jgi:hypothetical protein
MKRGGFLQRKTPLSAKTKLRIEGKSDTFEVKRNIQDLARDIVIIRDGGCILRGIYGIPECSGYATDGHLILQADHLITRGNSATYADTRLIVCLCKGHHGGWKRWNKEQYDVLVKTLLPPERVRLWEACERDSWRQHRTGAYDWKLAEAALRAELQSLQA